MQMSRADIPKYLIRDPKGTIVPLILATDQTTLTNNPKGLKGYPVYLSIGNISKTVRRRPTKRAMVIIGYLPVEDFEDVVNRETQANYRGELLHKSLTELLMPLRTASSDGMLAWCADGHLQHLYPTITAWVADWPEQNDIACTCRNGCPRCMQKWTGCGQGGNTAALRDRDRAIDAFQTYRNTKSSAKLDALRLKPWPAFWENIPELEIGMCFTPDLLHQLYKGMYEHARDWAEDLLGMKEFNDRFKSIPQAKGLRHFKRGVTKVKVWTGRESREMMRQFLPIVIDAQAPADFVHVMRALLDFAFLAEREMLTDIELAELEGALEIFHREKQVLVDLTLIPGRNTFNRIPKLHMLGHYAESIRELGTPDGYSTETPEHLHILYVKNGWRKSNQRNPMPQIVDYVRWLEAIQIQHTLIDEYYGDYMGTEAEERMYGFGEYNVGSKQDDDPSEGRDDLEEVDEEDNSDEEDDNEDSDGEQICSKHEGLNHYPLPSISISQRPHLPAISGRGLITSYGAADLIRELGRFLMPKARLRCEDLLILPSDEFPVWHWATLTHSAPLTALNGPIQWDVVRAHPTTRDAASRIRKT
ncbi:hypothetical protein FRC11_008550, partial [Ceratobasidium sp. 423]